MHRNPAWRSGFLVNPPGNIKGWVNRTTDFSTLQLVLGRSYSLLFNPQFQSFKLLLGHALQSHRCGQIQSGNVFHFVAPCYLATEFLYFWVSAHSQKHFIRIGDGQSLFNQAMLNQNAMIRRYCQRRWMGPRNALVLSWVFHCTMLTCFFNLVISLALIRSKIVSSGLNAMRFCATLRLRTNRYL